MSFWQYSRFTNNPCHTSIFIKLEGGKYYMTLKDLSVGDVAIITKVCGKNPLRLRLLDMGIIPNTLVKIQKVAPLGDPIQIQIRGYELTIRKEDAAKIQIRIGDATK